jgi:hypothetical protein
MAGRDVLAGRRRHQIERHPALALTPTDDRQPELEQPEQQPPLCRLSLGEALEALAARSAGSAGSRI